MKYVTAILLIAALVFPFTSVPLSLAEDEHGHDHGESESGHAHGDKDEHGHEDGKGKHEEGEGDHAHGAQEGGDGHGHGHEEAGPTELPDEALARFGLSLRKAGTGDIHEGIQVSGRIVPVDEKLAHVSPRFSGVIKEVRAKVGDVVKADTLLAVLQNNQNLQTFSLYPSIPGTVIKRHATLGETVREEDVIFIVADLSEVWAELAVYKQDVDDVKVGQKAILSVASHMKPIEGEVIFFSPITEERTQSRLARVRIKNPDPHFSPGAFVSGQIATRSDTVSVLIDGSAVQRVEAKDVVFVREKNSFEARPVVIGRKGQNGLEVLSGLKGGETYAAGNTFILKADLGKSEAEHEH